MPPSLLCWLFILSLLILINSTTDLTTSNCPSSFDVQSYNSTLDTQYSSLAISIYSYALTTQLQTKITASIQQGQIYTIQDYFTSQQFLLPYILVCSFFLLIYCTTICCCTFQRRCPPCKSIRRNYIKNPYTNCQRRLTMFLAIIFSIGILVATIIIFSSLTSLRKDVEMVECSIYYSVDVATSGDQERNWGGFGQVQAQLASITGLLEDTATEVNNQLADNSWIREGFWNMENMNLELYERNLDAKVLTPDPAATYTANQNSDPLPLITPYFIQNGLGPNGTADTMLNDISSGFSITKVLADQAEITYRAAMTFANSATNITHNTNSNLQQITQASDLLASIQLGVQTFQETYLLIVNSYGFYVLQILFGLVLLGSLMSLLGIIATHIFDLFTCRSLVNAGWVLYGLLYCLVVVVLFLFLVNGATTYSFCQYYQGVLSDENSFASYSGQSNSASANKLFSYLDVCFFGDGNILKKFAVAEQMETVSSLFLNIQTFLDMQTSGNSQYVDVSTSTSKILAWMDTLSKYASGIYKDEDSSIVTQQNPYISLANFNELTLSHNSTVTDHLCSNDLWVFDSTNCSHSASQSLYSPSADNTNGLYFPPTGTLCISFNTRLSNSAPSIWTSANIAQRYLNQRSCNSTSSTTAYTQILKYAQSLTNYRDSRKNVYQSLYDQVNELLLENTNYNTNMSGFQANVNTFYSSVATLNNLVTNKINGLTISANCTVIADSFRFFYNMYCVNFLNRSIKITVSCIVILVLMVGAVLAGSFFGVRFKRVEKERRLTKVEMESQVFQQESARSQESGQSEDSSEREHN